SARDFDPDGWKGEYPNPAFGRLTEHDAAWAARIIARLTPAHVEAAVRVGDFTNPAHAQHLTTILVERRRVLLRRYFSRLSPLTDVTYENGALCAVDLARRTETFTPESFRYAATAARAGNAAVPLAVTPEANGRVCVPLPSAVPNHAGPD